jgi:hypothetical protein
MTSNAAALILLLCAGGGGVETVDSILAKTWQSQGIEPAAVCSDEEFLRRVSLDIIGRIPTLDELNSFKGNSDRAAKIDELLASGDFPRFWSEVWTATFNGYISLYGSDREVLRLWLVDAFAKEMPYDRLVTRLITAKGSSAFDGPTNFLVRYPEEPAVKISRLFLGVRLDCARCHDHPFDRWTQEDFVLMNRFFEATDRHEVSAGNVRLVNGRPGRDEENRPRFLTGARPQTTQWRDEFALFMTNSKPFARTFVNRVWYHFMGRGIVHPPDDFNRENPAAVPALLEYLASTTRQDGFRLKPLIRTICNARAYQLSSRQATRNPAHEAVFAYRIVKPLTPEQTFDSAVIALGLEVNATERREFIRNTVGESLDEDYSVTWKYRETVQGLMSRLNQHLPVPSQSVDQLYLKILTRRPSDRERQLCQDQRAEDIVFALVNSNEFFFNH